MWQGKHVEIRERKSKAYQRDGMTIDKGNTVQECSSFHFGAVELKI